MLIKINFWFAIFDQLKRKEVLILEKSTIN